MNTKIEIPKANRQKNNWMIDLFMFLGFLAMFFLDITGLIFHQWVGMGIGLMVLLHLIFHWEWVKAVTQRFFDCSSRRARIYYLIDAGLAGGFLLIMVTGLVISSWLNMQLENYVVWKNIHILASAFTLAILMVKITLHWRWISDVGRRYIFAKNHEYRKATIPQPTVSTVASNRREFLKVMGITGVAGLIAASRIFKAFDETEMVSANEESGVQAATATPASQVVSQPTSTVAVAGDTQVSTATTMPIAQATATEVNSPAVSCMIRCNRGCSYPGHCRRYTDQNGNGLCDMGECL